MATTCEHAIDVENGHRCFECERMSAGRDLTERGSVVALNRLPDYQFVPDEHGGHLLTKYGDKWYPEGRDPKTQDLQEELDAANETIRRLTWRLQRMVD